MNQVESRNPQCVVLLCFSLWLQIKRLMLRVKANHHEMNKKYYDRERKCSLKPFRSLFLLVPYSHRLLKNIHIYIYIYV